MAAADAVRARYRAAFAAAHRAETTARARHPHTLSVSRLSGCTRQAAYALAQAPVTDPAPAVEGRAANHGTWLHEGLLPRLADQVNGKHETSVVVHAAGVSITGRADLTVVEGPDGDELVDVKTVNGLDGVRRHGDGYDEHWVQVMAYVLGERQRGRRIAWAVLIYVDRGTGAEEVFVRPVTQATLLAVVDRIGEIVRLSATPTAAPRVTAALPGDRRWRLRGPGRSWACDDCPFLTGCWGPGAKPGVVGAQRNLVRNDTAREAAIGAYAEASRLAATSAEERDFWRSVLDGSPPGLYGPWRLSWNRAGAISIKATRPVQEAPQCSDG